MGRASSVTFSAFEADPSLREEDEIELVLLALQFVAYFVDVLQEVQVFGFGDFAQTGILHT